MIDLLAEGQVTASSKEADAGLKFFPDSRGVQRSSQFTAWYCSELRLAFHRIAVVRYRMHLESRGLAANTINQHLAAVRRLAQQSRPYKIRTTHFDAY